ncbi:MAG: EAL domain-containing protein [Proteobacteria bacterium]|nr:EAL domain-containing protein [Pseudomonadota bacterium]
MRLRNQLFVAISLVFLLIFFGFMYVSVSATKGYLEEQLGSHAQDAATSLSYPLAESLARSDVSLAKTQVSMVFDRGYYQKITVISPTGVIVDKSLPPKIENIPLWFSDLVPLEIPSGEAFVSAGWRQLGKVIVTSQPTQAYQHLWRISTELLVWLAVIYAGSMALIQLMLHLILHPLRLIEQSAQSVQHMHFEQIAILPRAPELASVVKAMNDMSRRVSEMLDADMAKAEDLRKQAHDDSMTGLANRRGFELRLNELLDGDLQFSSAAVIAVELDNMRMFSWSHGFGECLALLQAVAHAARDVLGGQHVTIFARTGEFSFSFVVVDLSTERVAEMAAELRLRMVRDIERRPAVGYVSFCIGVAYFHKDDKPSDVFAQADLAVESSRHSGRNRLMVLPDQHRETSSLGSFGWHMLIANALAEKRLLLMGQPVVSLTDPKTLLHVELLARLIDTHGQLVPASNFLPMAARHRLMPDIDQALVGLALANLEQKENGNDNIALNLSPQSIADEGFVAWLAEKLSDLEGAGKRISIEVSEFGVLRNTVVAVQLREIARRHGAKFGIDHFGLDSQALELMRQLAPDYVKLTGSLIRDMTLDDQVNQRLLLIVKLAHSLNLKVIAQNVETEAQIAALVAAKVDGGQGYYFGAPELA